jgi:predicted nucleic acid-binding protein
VTSLVLDASAALCWCFEEEGSEAADRLLERLRMEPAVVPELWFLEVANSVALAERRQRITPADSAEFIALLEALHVEVDGETRARAFGAVLDLARRERLSAYDAAYLELAMRLGVPLASKDGPLCDAAERVGVSVIRVA